MKVPSLESDTRVFAYWGNEDNTTLPTYDFGLNIRQFGIWMIIRMIQVRP